MKSLFIILTLALTLPAFAQENLGLPECTKGSSQKRGTASDKSESSKEVSKDGSGSVEN